MLESHNHGARLGQNKVEVARLLLNSRTWTSKLLATKQQKTYHRYSFKA